jgi:hypothetical protein
MPLRWLGPDSRAAFHARPCLYIFLIAAWVAVAGAMSPRRIAELHRETVDMFYHGYDNYMNIAFPEDEVYHPLIESYDNR